MRWRNAGAVWVLSVVFLAVPLVEYASADPIVIVPNGGLGWVDTTVTDPGEPGGSDASGSGATRGSARGSGVTCTYTPVGLASLGTDLAESLVRPIGGLNGLRMGFFARSCSDGSLDIVWRDPFALGGGHPRAARAGGVQPVAVAGAPGAVQPRAPDVGRSCLDGAYPDVVVGRGLVHALAAYERGRGVGSGDRAAGPHAVGPRRRRPAGRVRGTRCAVACRFGRLGVAVQVRLPDVVSGGTRPEFQRCRDG
jgi:hypothetical protein